MWLNKNVLPSPLCQGCKVAHMLSHLCGDAYGKVAKRSAKLSLSVVPTADFLPDEGSTYLTRVLLGSSRLNVSTSMISLVHLHKEIHSCGKTDQAVSDFTARALEIETILFVGGNENGGSSSLCRTELGTQGPSPNRAVVDCEARQLLESRRG